MMADNLDEAFEQVCELVNSDIAERLKNANEAETRLLLINKVLSILGWQEEEYKPEQSTSTGGYTDYLLSIDGQPRLIVEAKKTGALAPLLSSIQKPQYTNGFLYKSGGEEIRVLLDQCRRYCSDKGLRFVVATTGNVWIILFGATLVGVEWGSIKSFVFHSLNDIADRFAIFYGLISRESVKSGILEEEFGRLILIKPSFAAKPRNKVHAATPIGDVPNRREISLYFDQYWTDITRQDREDMLDYCYVDTREVTEFSKELRSLLEYDEVLNEQGFAIEDVDQQMLEREVADQFDADDPKTILLVGKIGAGKSTFVHKFMREQPTSKKTVCIVVDLINRATIKVEQDREEEQRLARLILERLNEHFQGEFDPYDRGVLRSCFRKEIGWFKGARQELFQKKPDEYAILEEEHVSELSKDKYNHLVGYIKYVRSKRFKIWITLDNLDQGSDSYQAFVYAFAHQLTTDARCITMITLREDTYLSAKENGFLGVRGSDQIFRLNAPDLREVIAKRRSYIDHAIKHNTLSRSLKKSSKLVELLNFHIKVLFSEKDDRLRKLVTALSLNNIRSALIMIKQYYISYHSLFGEMLSLSAEKESSSISDVNMNLEFTHFIQSLMLGDSWSYDQMDSEIFNLFDVDPNIQGSHFLGLRILAYLSRFSTKQTVPYENLNRDFVLMGHLRHHVETMIRRLLSASLIVSPNLPQSHINGKGTKLQTQLPKDLRLVLSARGYYYLSDLASHQYYQARVGEDTFWYDEEKFTVYSRALQDALDVQEAYGRQDVLLNETSARSIFLQYLRKSLFEEAQSGAISPQNELSRVINSVVEQRVFNEQVTDVVFTQEDANSSHSEPLFVTQSPIPKVDFKKLRKNSLDNLVEAVQQLTFDEYEIDHNRDIISAIESLCPLPLELSYQRSTNIVRVLWALELAFRAGLPPLRASAITDIINDYGKRDVAAPNIAKFFRNQRKTGDYNHYWNEEHGLYTINQFGRDFLMSLLEKHNS